jgi:hypothetical protein
LALRLLLLLGRGLTLHWGNGLLHRAKCGFEFRPAFVVQIQTAVQFVDHGFEWGEVRCRLLGGPAMTFKHFFEGFKGFWVACADPKSQFLPVEDCGDGQVVLGCGGNEVLGELHIRLLPCEFFVVLAEAFAGSAMVSGEFFLVGWSKRRIFFGFYWGFSILGIPRRGGFYCYFWSSWFSCLRCWGCQAIKNISLTEGFHIRGCRGNAFARISGNSRLCSRACRCLVTYNWRGCGYAS